jgi:5-methylcytosine-specific restriction protein B
MDNKEAFKGYLKNEYKKNSGAPSSYIKALEYLSNSSDVNRNIFEIEDHYFLKKLYKETLLNQKKNDGKYYNDAHSYGSGGHYSAALFVYMEFLKTKDNNKTPKKMSSIPLNQILYGPPGTGKTYNTINKAIEIVNPDFDLTQDRNIVKLEFDRLCKEKRIHFTTFHQSLSYEDFIEGIKPCIEEEDDNTELKYEIQNGIFKRISDEASFELLSNSESVSNPLLNFSAKFDAFLTEVARKLEENEEVGISTKTGNKLVILSISDRGNFNIKHVDGERIYTVSKQRLMRLKEGINDLYTVENMNRDFRAVIGGSNSSVYWSIWNAVENTNVDDEEVVSERKWSESDKSDFVESSKPEDYKDKNGSPYVIIIDEINRGNVSQIFGELITLIEDEKRLGNDEGLKIQLPYSKKNYGVPNNLFILGTMNTADRSVEALDTALRRRFSFVEMLPKPETIEKGKSGGKVGDINLVQLLKTINERIEILVDRDHTIGHAFFMGVDSPESLQAVIADKIIPLLQEYFYGDYQKMEMVLGELFFEKKEANDVVFATGGELPFEGQVYTIKNVKTMEEDIFLKAIEGIKYREAKA